MNPKELREKRNKALADARSIVNAAEAGSRELTAEERAAFDAKITEAETLLADAVRMERFAVMEEESRQSQGRESNPLPHEDPGNTRQGVHSYSLLKAMREALAKREGSGPGMTGIELETHQELVNRRMAEGVRELPKGILVPWSLSVDVAASRRFARRNGLAAPERRALDTTAGTGSIPTIFDATMIDLLRARMVTREMGAKVMEGMQGLFAIPRQSGAGTFYMVGEAGAPTASNQTIDQVPYTPHTGGAYTDYTRRFLHQTNQDAEQFVRDDLTAITARGVEGQGLNGSGSGNNCKGLLQNSGITTVPIGTNGGAPTWDELVGLESAVATANADMGSLGYVTDAAVRGKLKRTLKTGSTFPVYLWNADVKDTPVNGYGCGITNLLPADLTKGTGTALHTILFGNWSDMIYAFWTGVEILVDPYSNSTSGSVRIVALQDFDVNIRHPESFAKTVDIDPT